MADPNKFAVAAPAAVAVSESPAVDPEAPEETKSTKSEEGESDDDMGFNLFE